MDFEAYMSALKDQGLDIEEEEDLVFDKHKDDPDFDYIDDAVIFVIDCSKSMLEKNEYNEGKESSVITCLKAALGFMKTKVISGENDKIGIILYNVQSDDAMSKRDNMKILLPLNIPTAENIKKIEAILKSVD